MNKVTQEGVEFKERSRGHQGHKGDRGGIEQREVRVCVPDTEESRGRGAGGQGHPLQRWSGDRQAPG